MKLNTVLFTCFLYKILNYLRYLCQNGLCSPQSLSPNCGMVYCKEAYTAGSLFTATQTLPSFYDSLSSFFACWLRKIWANVKSFSSFSYHNTPTRWLYSCCQKFTKTRIFKLQDAKRRLLFRIISAAYFKRNGFRPPLQGEGEGKVAAFSAKRWHRRNRSALIESATPCHDAQGCWWDLNPVRLTVLAAKSVDYNTVP